jgi:phage gpG-like protein
VPARPGASRRPASPAKSGARVEIEGLREFLRDSRSIDRAIPRDTRRAIKAAATATILPDARHRAPRSPVAKPEKQHLQGSLSVSARGDSVFIRSPLPYARIVHDGGRRPTRNRDKWIQVPGRPFIQEAADVHGDEALAAVEAALDLTMRRYGFR